MEKVKKVRVGVIGSGGISQVTHIPNLKANSSVEIVAICDLDTGKSATVANRFGVKNYFDDPYKMLKSVDIDAVVVTTPTHSHLPICQLVLESNADVYIEKPFARTIEEAIEILDTADKTKRIVMVGMNHRFREDVVALKKMLEDKRLGDITTIRSGWLKQIGIWGRPHWFTDKKQAGGGVLMDLGVQMIDLIMYLLDFPDVIETSCSLSDSILGLEVEDSAATFIRFANQSTLLLTVSWAECYDRDIAFTYFSGIYGAASLNPLRITRRQRDKIDVVTQKVIQDQSELHRRSYIAAMNHFIECVQTRKQPIASGFDAIHTIGVVGRLYQQFGI